MSDLERDRNGEIKTHTLKQITPEEMLSYIGPRLISHVHIETAPEGKVITIPPGWHGEGHQGTALVMFDDLLTTPMAGTELPSSEFISWLARDSFVFESEAERVSPLRASELLSSDAYVVASRDKPVDPVLRIFRHSEPGSAGIELEYYGGSLNPFIQRASSIGNKDIPSKMDKGNFQAMITTLFYPFISKGTRSERNRVGIRDDMPRIRRIDDCFAAWTTGLADIVMDEKRHGSHREVFETHEAAIATTHAASLIVDSAKRRNRDTLIRIGAPTFGLLGEKDGLGYMGNTQPEMLVHGKYTTGDIGILLDEGDSDNEVPHVVPGIIARARIQIRVYLGGGLPVYRMALEGYREKGKPMPPVVFIRAKRVDNGPEHWGVLMSGTELAAFDLPLHSVA